MLYDNKCWIADIDKVLEVIPELGNLDGQSVLITGVSGLICSSIADILFRFNDRYHTKINILAAGRSYQSVYNRFQKMVCRDDFTYVAFDASKTDNILDVHADYIIHGASNAYPNVIITEPVETMLSNFLGMKNLLDYAREQRTKRILYISSSEVYGENEDNNPFHEDQYGYIDLLNTRNSYSISKRAAETLCVSFSKEYDVETVIVRPGHIYGPTASPLDNRVASAWAYSAARGNNIIMKSDGSQIRSYCYCLDCASAILKVLLCGRNCHAYNISNPYSIISIKDMAKILEKCSGVQITYEIPAEEEKRAFNPMKNSSLESSSLLNLGWYGCFDAPTGFDHTVKILKEVLF